MSLTGSGPADPQRVGVPIGDLLAGMYGAFGLLAALIERSSAPGVARWSGLRCWLRWSAFTLSRGRHGPLPGRLGMRRAIITRRSLRTGCSAVLGAASSFPAATTVCGGGCVRSSGSTRGAARYGHQSGERVGHRGEVIALLEQAFAATEAPELLARLSAAGVPAGKVRTLDEVYAWDQVEAQGLRRFPLTTRRWVRSPCPVRRCGFSRPDPGERRRPRGAVTRPRQPWMPTGPASGPGWTARRFGRTRTAAERADDAAGRAGSHDRWEPRWKQQQRIDSPHSGSRGWGLTNSSTRCWTAARSSAGMRRSFPTRAIDPKLRGPSWRPRAAKCRHRRVGDHRLGA